jgi:hypothetical protein
MHRIGNSKDFQSRQIQENIIKQLQLTTNYYGEFLL